jgi:hypothetical protein
LPASTVPIGDGKPVLGTVRKDTQQGSQAVNHDESGAAEVEMELEPSSLG